MDHDKQHRPDEFYESHEPFTAGVTPDLMARVFVKRPGMYLGGPVTFERAAGFVEGYATALAMAGAPVDRPLEHHELLRHGVANGETEEDAIRRLAPVLEALFSQAVAIRAAGGSAGASPR